jgi:hypothetical protein
VVREGDMFAGVGTEKGDVDRDVISVAGIVFDVGDVF